VEPQNSSETNTVTTKTTTQAATGIRVTVVVPRTTTNFARNASARTAPTSQRVTTVSSQSRKDAVHRTGKAMETVTITTITLVAAGMEATVAVPKITNTAKNANARTAHT